MTVPADDVPIDDVPVHAAIVTDVPVQAVPADAAWTVAVPGGLFLSFEGGDGAGKSTQLGLLAQWLRDRGHEVVTTREPGGTPLGAVLREAVLHGDHVGARTEALLYAADRAHHVDTVVRPALRRGAVVITDRYLDSSVAYQGTGRELGVKEVERLSLWAVEGLLPRLTVLLDLDPVIGLGRLPGRPDRLESAGTLFHARVRSCFLERAAAQPERWLVLDAGSPVDRVQDRIRVAVTELLDPGGGGVGGAHLTGAEVHVSGTERSGGDRSAAT